MLSTEANIEPYLFLQGGGEMGALTRQHDWSKTRLGTPDQWPQSLRTTLGILLHSAFPMVLFWGDELICFYNDAFRPSLGIDGKHPAVGKRGQVVWSEIWDFIGPLLEQVMQTGEPVYFEDQLVPFYRNGRMEDIYWTFSYSPAYNDTGQIGGVFVTCTETTQKVRTINQLQLSEQRFRSMVEQVPVAMAIFRGSDHIIETFNEAYQQLVGRTADELLGKPMFEAIPEIKGLGYEELLANVLITGEPYYAYELSAPLLRNGKRETVYFNFVYQPLREEDGSVTGVTVVANEIIEQEMARQKRTYETITASTPDLIYVFGLDYRFTYVNKALLTMWGKTWEQSVGKSLLENGYEPWHAAMHEREIDQVVATQQPIRGEVSFPHATLGRRIYDYIFVPVFNNKGEVEAVAGTTRDITELKQAELMIRESEERLRFTLKAGHLGSWELDLATGTLDASDYCKANFGQPLDQPFTYQTLREAIHPDDRQQQEDAVTNTLTTGADYDIEYRAIWPDKTVHWMNIRGQLHRNSEGIPVTLIGVSIDITDKKNAEAILKESEAKLRAVIQNAPESVAIGLFVGRDLIIDTPNQAFLNTVGRGSSIEGKPLREVMPELESQPFLHLLDEVYTTGQGYQSFGTPVNIMHDGVLTTRHFNISFTPLFDSSGNVYAILDISFDVTEQVRAHQKLEENESRYRVLSEALDLQVQERTEELAAANEKLAASNIELTESNQLLIRSNENLQTFAYIASHDLQEPLRKIQQFGDLLKTRYADSTGDELVYLERMQSAASRMSTLIKDLLNFSRISTKRDTSLPVALNAVVEDVLATLELPIRESGAQIRVKPLPIVSGDASQLGQLFQNLLSNALKFCRADTVPVIEVNARLIEAVDLPTSVRPARPAKQYHCIDVADNGIGFDEKYLDRIFQVFQRLHGKRDFAGTGIGLSICERVATNHGGAITASSQPGQGATFSVYLPH